MNRGGGGGDKGGRKVFGKKFVLREEKGVSALNLPMSVLIDFKEKEVHGIGFRGVGQETDIKLDFKTI